MKCTRCRSRAEIGLRAHNANFCRPCYLFWFRRRVVRAIEKQEMFTRDSRILVAVSGGKDSFMSSYERIDIDFWASRLGSFCQESSQVRALLAGLTRLTLYGLVSYSCLSVTRWLGQTSFRAQPFAHVLRIEEICRSNYIDHGASIHSKGLTAGPLLRAL